MPDIQKPDQFPCPTCAAPMQFDPQSGELKCPHCSHLHAIPHDAGICLHALEEAMNHQGGMPMIKALEVHCTGCGGQVIFAPPEVAGDCSFCGSPIVAEPKAADPLIAPDAVLPAKITKETARAKVQEWLGTRWFAPNALKDMVRTENIKGVYLPFWIYDSDTQSSYVGERGEHYYETETYTETDDDGNTVTQTREVQRTAWYPAAGRVARNFKNLLIAATKSVTEKYLNKLSPWNLAELCAYEPAFLAGFKAQRYQVELGDGFQKAKSVMQGQIHSDVCVDIGGDEQRVLSIDTAYANNMFRHLLLPIWIGAYRFGDKPYQVLVNAATGQVQGERPYSVWKISLLVAAVLILIWLAVLFSSHK